ncbi:hypothetical protein AB6A40_006755 [Gnathostoma spinigerum]|uniref:LAS1-like protein n=1 Tax=Gnathostoma spinigerum TaxID=75299 RepID=A0ABD6EJW4_9BILA
MFPKSDNCNLHVLYNIVGIAVTMKLFVNYVNEMCQAERARFSSIVVAVQSLGIPRWIVDIRHEATHSYMPDLKSLRMAADFCRSWLWDKFWSRPVQEVMRTEPTSNQSVNNVQLSQSVDILVRYVKFRMSNRTYTFDPKKKISYKILKRIKNYLIEHASEFVAALLRDGFLILTSEHLTSIDYDIDDNEKGRSLWRIPEGLQLFWQPVLSLLYDAKAFPVFLNGLLKRLQDEEKTYESERQLLSWTHLLLNSMLISDIITELEWTNIIQNMVSIHDMLEKDDLVELLNKLELQSPGKWSQLRNLIELSSKAYQQVDVPSNVNWKVKTVDDLRRMTGNGNGQGEVSNNELDEDWILANPNDWKGTPLGMTSSQTAESLTLIPQILQSEENQIILSDDDTPPPYKRRKK